MTADITTHAASTWAAALGRGVGLFQRTAAEVRPRRGLRQAHRAHTRSTRRQSPGVGSTAEAIAGIKLYLARNLFFELGGGYRIADAQRQALRLAPLHRLHLRAPDRRPRRRRLQGHVDQGAPDDPEDFDDFDMTATLIPTTTRMIPTSMTRPNDLETKNGYQDADGHPGQHHLRPRRRRGILNMSKGALTILRDGDNREDADGCLIPTITTRTASSV